jgi:hypothetical protein
MDDLVEIGMGNLKHPKILMFCLSAESAKLTHRAGEIHIFELESHACQSK